MSTADPEGSFFLPGQGSKPAGTSAGELGVTESLVAVSFKCSESGPARLDDNSESGDSDQIHRRDPRIRAVTLTR